MLYECPFSMQQNSYHFVVDYKVDLLGITETWLHMEGSDMAIGELCPNGYRLLHTPRLTGRGGGVGLLYKQGIGFKSKTRLCEHSFTSFECMDVTFVARKSLRVIVVYRPPGECVGWSLSGGIF